MVKTFRDLKTGDNLFIESYRTQESKKAVVTRIDFNPKARTVFISYWYGDENGPIIGTSLVISEDDLDKIYVISTEYIDYEDKIFRL